MLNYNKKALICYQPLRSGYSCLLANLKILKLAETVHISSNHILQKYSSCCYIQNDMTRWAFWL